MLTEDENDCSSRKGRKGVPRESQRLALWLVAPNLLIPGSALPAPLLISVLERP